MNLAIGDRFPEVLSAASEGADWAWAELYQELAPALLRFLIRQGAPDPEDCLGECFVQLVRKLPDFTGDEAALRAWAFQVARNRVIDAWRAANRRPATSIGDPQVVQDRLRHHESADGDLLRRDAVVEVLGRLSPDQRAVLVLRVLEGFSVEQTAGIMGKSAGAVRVLQNRAVNSLRKSLAPEQS